MSKIDTFFDWKDGFPIKADCEDCTEAYQPYGCFFCEHKYWSTENLEVEGCGLGHPTIRAKILRFNNPHVKRRLYTVMYRTPTPKEMLNNA